MGNKLVKSLEKFLKGIKISFAIVFIVVGIFATILFYTLKHSRENNLHTTYPNSEVIFAQALASDGWVENTSYFLHRTEFSEYIPILVYAVLLTLAIRRVVRAIRKRLRKGLLKTLSLLTLASVVFSGMDLINQVQYWIWQDSAIWAEVQAQEEGRGEDEDYKKSLRNARRFFISIGMLLGSSQDNFPALNKQYANQKGTRQVLT